MGTSLSANYDDVNFDDYRFVVCAGYLVFYRVDEVNVYIDRIMYGRRDYITILFGELSDDDTE